MRAAALLLVLSLGTALASAGAACGTSSSKASPDAGGDARADAPGDPPPVSTSPGTTGAVPHVNVFVGTAAGTVKNPVPNGEGGSTHPAASSPFGMVQWGPDTPYAQPAGYDYKDSQITGFPMTHLSGAGCAALRDFPVFPVSGSWDPGAAPLVGFSHGDEVASPGFYEVTVDGGIRIDLTATQRAGLGRFTFPHAPAGTLVITGAGRSDGLYVSDARIDIGQDGVVTGERTDAFFCATAPTHKVHFAARFDRPFSAFGAFEQGALKPGARTGSGPDSGVTLTFDTSSDGAVQMKVGLSYVSAANALANLDAEIPAWSFDDVHAAAVARWNAALGRVAATGGTEDETRALYTALYHVLLQPAVASDTNGQYVRMDGKVAKAEGYTRYQNYSGWDIYRSWIQLVSVIAPSEASDIVRSLVLAGQECGAMPRWALASTETGVMVGDPGDPIVASGYAFGARGFDAKAALAGMLHAATDPTAACNGMPIRPGLGDYLALHYCPLDGKDAPAGNASTTVEYAMDDFAIAQLAGALGDASTRATFLARAASWKNVFDPVRAADGFTGYLQPRYAKDVGGMPAFQQVDVGSYDALGGESGSPFVEGNAAQYTVAVSHDVYGLVSALGGDAKLVSRLDRFFEELNAGTNAPFFYMGNEPGFVSPWLYDFAGAPYKTQAVVRRLLTQTFDTTPSGLPGNDDLGAMSAWQAWALLGLYPAVPGVGGLVTASPTFPEVTIALASGKKLVVTARGGARDAPYVQGLTVDGKPWTSAWLPWSRLEGGATLEFSLGKTPDTSWGAAPADRPPDFMK